MPMTTALESEGSASFWAMFWETVRSVVGVREPLALVNVKASTWRPLASFTAARPIRFSEIARKALVLLFPDFEYLFSELIGLFGNELVFYCGIATLD